MTTATANARACVPLASLAPLVNTMSGLSQWFCPNLSGEWIAGSEIRCTWPGLDVEQRLRVHEITPHGFSVSGIGADGSEQTQRLHARAALQGTTVEVEHHGLQSPDLVAGTAAGWTVALARLVYRAELGVDRGPQYAAQTFVANGAEFLKALAAKCAEPPQRSLVDATPFVQAFAVDSWPGIISARVFPLRAHTLDIAAIEAWSWGNNFEVADEVRAWASEMQALLGTTTACET